MERKGGNTAVVTARTVSTGLAKASTTVEEERALRMRYGATVERDAPLPQAHEGNEELQDELLLIEMALMRAYRQRMQAQAAQAPKAKPAARKSAAKSKIVAALKTKKK